MSDFASRVAGEVATKLDEQSRFAALVAGEALKGCGQEADPGRAKHLLHYGCVIEREVRDHAGYKVTKRGKEIAFSETLETAMWIARNSEY